MSHVRWHGGILAAIKTVPERVHGEAWASCKAQRGFIAEKLKERLRLSKVRKLLARRGVIVPYPAPLRSGP